MATKAEKITELLVVISNKSGRIKKLKLECGQQATQICVLNLRIKELEGTMEKALRISDLWTLGPEVDIMFEDEAKALLAMKTSFEQVLKG